MTQAASGSIFAARSKLLKASARLFWASRAQPMAKWFADDS